jgi:tetratricopeptide (TPR) repeat protein
MMSSFLVPLIFFTAFAFSRVLEAAEKRQILVAVTLLSVIQSAFFLGINANEERHLRRAEVLTNPLFLGEFAQKLLYDRLANIMWDRKDYQRSRYWYGRYLELDSTNPRIIANLSDVYSKLNDPENEFRMLKRSVELGSRNPSVYSNVGVKYFKQNEIQKAIAAFRGALAIDSLHPVSNANIGLCYTLIKEHAAAVKYLERAYLLGMRDAPIVNSMADNYVALKNVQKAIGYYRIYLRMQPSDTLVQKRLRQLEGIRKLK